MASWEAMVEAARTLQLKYSIDPTHIIYIGDFNAHLSSSSAGIPDEATMVRRRDH